MKKIFILTSVVILSLSLINAQGREINFLTNGDIEHSYLHDFFSRTYYSEINFQSGDYMISQNKEYLLRQTINKKNIEIIHREKNEFGQWQFIEQIWQSDRDPESFWDFRGLTMEQNCLTMLPKTAVYNRWDKTCQFHSLKISTDNIAGIATFVSPSAYLASFVFNVCTPRFINTLYLQDDGVLLLESQSREIACSVSSQPIWTSTDGYARRLISDDIKEHFEENGFDVIDNNYLQSGESLGPNQILFSEDESIFLNKCMVFRLSDFISEVTGNLDEEKKDIETVNIIPGCVKSSE